MTAILMIVFGIVLPSVDVYSDSYFSFKMFTLDGSYDWYGNYKQVGSQPVYGTMMLIPIVISTLFTLYHWGRLEIKWWHKLITLPLVLIQFWTQYRTIRILILGLWYQISSWRKEKKVFDKDLGSLGKMVGLQVSLCISLILFKKFLHRAFS